MALHTLGTNANNSIATSVTFGPGKAAADFASMCEAILNDLNPAHPVMPPSYVHEGKLYVPNRGILTMLPGDVIGVDSTGWPILVSKNAIANGPWTFT